MDQPHRYSNNQRKNETSTQATSVRSERAIEKHKSTGTIVLYLSLIFFPLICFSAVLLALVFHYIVDMVPSSFNFSSIASKRELPGGYYLVNFSATRLIFISSWSSSIAPTLVGLATALWLFPITSKLLKTSTNDTFSQLPTPYQFSMILGLSTASMSQIWKFMKYSFWKRKAKKVSMLRSMAGVLFTAQILALLIFVLDSILHFTTETVPFTRSSPNTGQFSSFSQGLIDQCTDSSTIIRLDTDVPCTYNVAATGDGFFDKSEVTATINNISTFHQILSTTYPSSISETDLLLLGPVLTDVPNSLEYQASTVGVATTCQPISQQCNLKAPYGASTPFSCNSNFYGDLQIPVVNTSSTLWSDSSAGNYLFGAIFQDDSLSVSYTNYSVLGLASPDPSNLINPFYMGIAVRAAFGTNQTLLENDPEITIPVHGGLAFILNCEVLALDITYRFFNGTITSYAATPSNGTIAWYFDGVMGAAGSLAHLSQGIDIAVAASNSQDVARAWARSYSQEALAILSSVHSARPNLEEVITETINVTKIPRAPLLALVAFNLVFAVLGLRLGIWALVTDSTGVATVYQGMSVEGLVARAFENGEMRAGKGIEDAFQERSGGGGAGQRVGVESVGRGVWAFIGKG